MKPCIYHGGGPSKSSFSAIPIFNELSKVKVDSFDTTENFLASKISVVGLSSSILNAGSNEILQITNTPIPESNQVKATVADTTKNYLDSKIAVTGGGITKSVINPGANEQVQLSVVIPSETGKVFVSAADTTKNFINSKIVVDSSLTKTILSPGGVETLELKVTAPGFTTRQLSISFGTGLAMGQGTFLVPGTAASSFPTNGMGFAFDEAITIKEIHYTWCRVGTYSVSESITMQVRKLTADGTATTEALYTTGTLIRQTVTTFGFNSGGNFRYYYMKGDDGLSIAVAAGQMVFVVCSAITANSVVGGVCHIVYEK